MADDSSCACTVQRSLVASAVPGRAAAAAPSAPHYCHQHLDLLLPAQSLGLTASSTSDVCPASFVGGRDVARHHLTCKHHRVTRSGPHLASSSALSPPTRRHSTQGKCLCMCDHNVALALDGDECRWCRVVTVPTGMTCDPHLPCVTPVTPPESTWTCWRREKNIS